MKTKNYKFFILMSFLLLGGCTTRHKNVVKGVGTIDNTPMLLLEDVKDKKERIFYLFESRKTRYGFTFTYLNDTVDILMGSLLVYNKSERDYQLDRAFYPGDYNIRFNQDSINARSARLDAHNDSVYAAGQYEKLKLLKRQIKPSPQNTK